MPRKACLNLFVHLPTTGIKANVNPKESRLGMSSLCVSLLDCVAGIEFGGTSFQSQFSWHAAAQRSTQFCAGAFSGPVQVRTIAAKAIPLFFHLLFKGVMLFSYWWLTRNCFIEVRIVAISLTLLWIQCIYIFSLSWQRGFFDSRNKGQTKLNFDEHFLNKLGLHAIIVIVNQFKPCWDLKWRPVWCK